MEIQSTKIFGIRAIIEAIESKATIQKVYLQKDLNGSLLNELKSLIKVEHIATSFVPVEKLNHLSKNNNHQGAVATISPISFQNLEEVLETVLATEQIPLVLMLDQITDVRNFGAIIRTAECCGVHAIVVQNHGSAPLNAEAIKTSAGAAFKVPICRVNHLKDALFMLQASEVQVVAATEKTDQVVYDIDFKVPTAILMGSEFKGVNPSILKLVDAKAKLPLYGEIASLNVSVACGAFLYETVRQRRV